MAVQEKWTQQVMKKRRAAERDAQATRQQRQAFEATATHITQRNTCCAYSSIAPLLKLVCGCRRGRILVYFDL